MRHVHRHAFLAFAAMAILFVDCRWIRRRVPAPTEGAGSAVGGQTGGPSGGFGAARSILQRACAATCHDGRASSADDFLIKDDGDLYGRLLDAAPSSVPPACQNRPLVVPGYPDRSLLFAMIGEPEAPRAGCAERMPHSCPDKRPCLSVDEIQAVRGWIEAGAPP
jgi:hypothetical protein